MDALLGLRCWEEPRRAYDVLGFFAGQATLGDALLRHQRSGEPFLDRRRLRISRFVPLWSHSVASPVPLELF